jgi:hypothetical protein
MRSAAVAVALTAAAVLVVALTAVAVAVALTAVAVLAVVGHRTRPEAVVVGARPRLRPILQEAAGVAVVPRLRLRPIRQAVAVVLRLHLRPIRQEAAVEP